MSTPILAKASMHRGGSKLTCRKHNVNLDGFRDGEENDGIDNTRTHLNVVLKDSDPKEFARDLLTEAILEQDNKNWVKHPSKVIGMSKAEYTELLAKMVERHGAEKGKEAADHIRADRAFNAYWKKHGQSEYVPSEIMFQLGDHDTYYEMIQRVSDNLTDREIKKSGLNRAELAQNKVDDFYKKYYTALVEKFERDNPTLRVYGAYIHLDELKNGAPHLHLDYIPIVESDKGMKVKISQNAALEKLGYSRKKYPKFNEQIKQWTEDTRTDIEKFAQDFCNSEYKDMWFILPHEKCDRPHQDQRKYNAEQSKLAAIKDKLLQALNTDLFSNDKKVREAAAKLIVENADAVEKIKKQEAEQEKEKAHRQELYNQALTESVEADRTAFEKEKAATVAEIEGNYQAKRQEIYEKQQETKKRLEAAKNAEKAAAEMKRRNEQTAARQDLIVQERVRIALNERKTPQQRRNEEADELYFQSRKDAFFDRLHQLNGDTQRPTKPKTTPIERD